MTDYEYLSQKWKQLGEAGDFEARVDQYDDVYELMKRWLDGSWHSEWAGTYDSCATYLYGRIDGAGI